MKVKINPNDKYFILENGKPKQVDTYEKWAAWSEENRERINTTLYFVEDGVVVNYFFYGRVEPIQFEDDGRPLLWWINEFDMSSDEYEEIYNKGIRIEGFDFQERIELIKVNENAEEPYEGLDSFSILPTQEDAIDYLNQKYGDWRSKATVLEPQKMPPLYF